MMTQTHMLVASAIFASPKRPIRQNIAIVFGGFVPDLAVFGLFIWSKLQGIPEHQLWREVYFSEPMLTYTAIDNSLPLYVSLLLVGTVWLKLRASANDLGVNQGYRHIATNSMIGLFSLAAITHIAGDFPVHADDAHPHFWPFTDWRFHSPISYWDHHHHGAGFSLFEAALGVILSIILFRRFKTKWVRGATLLAIFAYVGVPLYFKLQMS